MAGVELVLGPGTLLGPNTKFGSQTADGGLVLGPGTLLGPNTKLGLSAPTQAVAISVTDGIRVGDAPSHSGYGTRRLGDITVTVRAAVRIADRISVGDAAAARSPNLNVGLVHARVQGKPTLSARVMPTGLAHTRSITEPSVNPRTLSILALDRV